MEAMEGHPFNPPVCSKSVQRQTYAHAKGPNFRTCDISRISYTLGTVRMTGCREPALHPRTFPKGCMKHSATKL
eukprot:2228307-Amphidinium_carterae.1